MVATLDPRKNHSLVLDAFDLLWQSGSDVEICFVGRVGSRCDDLIERIRNHPQLGLRLHLFDDLADCELHHCYRHSRGAVFPSIVEGFGLPIVEALWHGKKTFVSDTEIHREVGQDDCCYFDLNAPQSLVDCIVDWERTLSDDSSWHPPTRRPATWGDSSEQFLEQCFQLFNGETGYPVDMGGQYRCLSPAIESPL
jgi:alpha-1,2-rhamnosyltransferase